MIDLSVPPDEEHLLMHEQPRLPPLARVGKWRLPDRRSYRFAWSRVASPHHPEAGSHRHSSCKHSLAVVDRGAAVSARCWLLRRRSSWLSFEPHFRGRGLARIADHRPYVAFPTEEDSKRFALTQVETIRSPVVLSRCLSQPEIAQLPELKEQPDP